ncbi:response regulator [Novipirellula aureliae]|uniref:Response regulator n=1 Tax=Novipirellula aureliae TaxID=2527966 RepID=A0A5C6DS30_9BACT|nr:helix-turn-helix transcriptional regulator [Novipirellula aureliae]TWU39055.1 response regulator [Novipirellula aureliae]
MENFSVPLSHHLDAAFAQEVERLFQEVWHALLRHEPVYPVIDAVSDCAYIKSADGQILHSNSIFEETFAGTVNSVGRFSADFLSETIRTVSLHSDALLLAGCSSVEFEHAGIDQRGRSLTLRTMKRSLTGCGHPRAAILGVTRIIEVKQCDSSELETPQLASLWNRFASLEDREQQVAVLVTKGETVKRMAALLKVSDKTIENRRNSAMKKLGVSTQAALICLMVRLQDNGYCDFGL